MIAAACQKEYADDRQQRQQQLAVQQFLALPPNSDTALVRIAAELSRQNTERNFIPSFVTDYGYAKWTYATRIEHDGVVNYLIPLGNDQSKQVHAIMQCFITPEKMLFALITKTNIESVLAKMPDRSDKPDRLTYKAMFRSFEHAIYKQPLVWVSVVDKQGNELYEYPAPDSLQPVRTKTYLIVTYCVKTIINVGNYNGGYTNGSTVGYHCWQQGVIAPDSDDDIWYNPGTGDNPNTGGGSNPNTGGGGSNPPPLPPMPPPTPKNPCDQLNNYLGKDTEFQKNMKILYDAVKEINKDYAYEMTKHDYDNGYRYDIKPGIQGECSIFYYPQYTIDGFLHSHDNGCLSIFSISDLAAMYDWYKSGRIEDINSFVFGLASKAGGYMLKVEDLSAFKKFGESALTDPTGRNALEYLYNDYLEIKTEKSNEFNESKFLIFLNTSKTGLKLYKSNSSDFSKWDGKGIDNNNQPITVNCPQ